MKIGIDQKLSPTPPDDCFKSEKNENGNLKIWTRIYSADNLDRSFCENNLILSKTIKIKIGRNKIIESPGVKVNNDGSITFSCEYPLNPIDLMSHHDVIDSNTLINIGTIGHLDYRLEVENMKSLINLGEIIKFKIIPENPGLVHSRIKSCKVTHLLNPDLSYVLFKPIQDQSESKFIFCRDKFLNFQILSDFHSSETQEFSFTSFQWDSGICFDRK